MLIEPTLFKETEDKVKNAILFLQKMEPVKGFDLAFSGGKDSIVVEKLANMAGVQYTAYYNVTTIDPPELIYFIRENYPDIKRNQPEKPLLVKMIEKGFPPLRQQRWCCELYKERGGKGKIITGIRREESKKRSKRKLVEFCYRDKSKIYINPILYWTENEVWEFIEKYKLKYCILYDQGWKRIGCLFCPMASQKNRLREVKAYPNYVNLFIRYFEKLVIQRKKNGKPLKKWKSGKDFFEWWIYNKQNPEPDQNILFE